VAGEEGLDRSAHQFAQAEDAGVGDVVDHAGPVAATAQDAGLGQCLKVAGGVGLGQAGCFDERRNRQLAVLEGADELEPVGLAQDPESSRDELQGLITDLAGGDAFHLLALGHDGKLPRTQDVFNNMWNCSWKVIEWALSEVGWLGYLSCEPRIASPRTGARDLMPPLHGMQNVAMQALPRRWEVAELFVACTVPLTIGTPGSSCSRKSSTTHYESYRN